MNKETAEALERSITYWENIVNGVDYPRGISGCALCSVFYKFDEIGNECSGCPVSEKTEEPTCEGTPFVDVLDFLDLVLEGRYILTKQVIDEMITKNREIYKQLCQAELDFLRGLR